LTQNRSPLLSPPRISVVVPVCAMSAEFESCLGAIKRLRPEPFELIVVIDGGDEAARRAALASGAKVEIITPRRGPAAARNAGALAASGDILFFVDADVAVPPDALEQLRSMFTAPGAPDAVIGSYDDAPPVTNFLSQYKNLVQHFVHQRARSEGYTFWGACGAIRRTVFLELGGFDERYSRPSIEDIELGYRLGDNGYAIRLSKTLQVAHLKRWTARRLFMSDFFCRAVPWSRLILCSGRMEDDLNINRAERLKVLLTYLLLLQIASSALFPVASVAAAVTALVLGGADWRLLRFFYRKRGVLFAARVPLWHWFYYTYSGFAFGMSSLERLFRRLPDRTPRGWPPDWNHVL
jgi:GT2 family glycosyltransferase